MPKPALRVLFTILMCGGVFIVLYPYISGHLYRDVFLLVVGAGITVVFGLCRCLFTDGDCSEQNRRVSKHTP